MGTITSTLTAGRRPSMATLNRRAYLADGWRRMKAWDGVSSATVGAGIAGPAASESVAPNWSPATSTVFTAGSQEFGTHLLRYRYMNSRNGYVSEPSQSFLWTCFSGSNRAEFKVRGTTTPAVLGGGATLTFAPTTITRSGGSWIVDAIYAVGDYVKITNAANTANNGTWGPITAITATVLTITKLWSEPDLTVSAGDATAKTGRAQNGSIAPSSDTNVDRIVIEITPVGSTSYRYGRDIPNTDGTTTIIDRGSEMNDDFLAWPDDDESSDPLHLLPPVAANVLAYRGRLWVYGQFVYSTGTVTVTNGLTAVTGAGTDWTTDALNVTTDGLGRGRRYLRISGDTDYYAIDSCSSATALVLQKAYAGTGGAGKAYTIFSLDDHVYYSEPGFPEAFPPESFVRGTGREFTTAVVGALNGLVLYSKASTEYHRYNENPATDGTRRVVSQDRGAVNARVAIVLEERAYALDRLGVHVFEGLSCKALSRPIETVVRRINFAVEETFHANYYPKLRAIRWWVALDDDVLPYHYLQLDLETGAWSMGEREVAVTASALAPSSDGVRVLLGDENGHVWFDDEGTTDGADDAPNARGTGTPTTTVVGVDTALPTTGTGLTGVTAYFERLGETRVISANTASQFTVSAAFSSAPVAGDRFQFGRVLAKLRTRAMAPGGFPGRGKPLQLHLWLKPTDAARSMRVRVYRDLADEAMTWGGAAARDDDEILGVTPPSSPTDTDFLVDTSVAFVRVPIGDDTASLATEVELELTESDAPVELLGLAVAAVATEGLV